ncbi:MAG: DUF3037 domain-containing protein [Acidobacteria bacterium]|nr:DUF3037 domain-containing protein [Acidobacteriota bacterium]
MPTRNSFDYAIIRVMPRVERGECVNAGVIVFCPEQKYLGARVSVDDARLQALWPLLDLSLIRSHLEAFIKVAEGGDGGGPLAQLSQRERFHWLVAPRSTIIQVSAVHSGLCENPGQALGQLFNQLVPLPPPDADPQAAATAK